MIEKQKFSDVIVIGGGPAGLSAALWCSELGMSTVLFEKEAEFGGQLLHIHNRIENYIGIKAANGREMRDIFLRSVENRDFLRRLKAEVIEIDAANKNVILSTGEIWAYSAIIIATGVRRRKLGVEGEDEFQGKGIIDSGSKYRENAAGKTVVIVGGGDAAIENALILAEFAVKVYVVHRSNEFRAREEFLKNVKENPKIELLTNSVVRKFCGGKQLESVIIENLQNGETNVLPVDISLIRIGVQPNTEILNGQIGLNDSGFITANAVSETNVPGIFAIGDAANPNSPTISTAAGTGATAVKAVLNWTNTLKTT
ncbi:MAG: FAD-dependent oxidoreductase [Pyrinomonadaceae bacterium]